jgi:prepilin-type N-terminal cleavage/methylation domain-containing protein
MFKISTNKAFTLIEVLVVTAVIALLASVVFASLSEARTEAEDKNKIQEANQVNNAIGIHRTSNGSAPSVASNYVAYNENSSEYQSAMGQLVSDGSMPEIPTSPNGQDYYYLVDDSGNGVFGAVLRSDSEINNNNGCYFTEPEFGCTGGGTTHEYNRDSLIAEGDSCSGACDGVGKSTFSETSFDYGWYSVATTYSDAVYNCSVVANGGNQDWRLPTVEEMKTVIQQKPASTSAKEWWFTSTETIGVSSINLSTQVFNSGEELALICIRP